MMPVPTHLSDCIVPKDSSIDETALDAIVRCPCGSLRFDLLFPGQTAEYHGEAIPVTAEINGNFFFLIQARCAKCQREHLLIDDDFHGWNGFVCHDPAQAALPRPPLVAWQCLACGWTEHEASVQVLTEGKADFVTETAGAFDIERWPDAFFCLNITIQCSGCGKETSYWVSDETM